VEGGIKLKKAFTLIELLIVVAIIAILAAIAVPNFLEAQTRAKVSRVLSDQRTYATALETYMIDNSSYPLHWPYSTGTFGGVNYAAIQNPPTQNINKALAAAQSPEPDNDWDVIPSFAIKHASGTVPPLSLTTPVSYLSTYVPDTFANMKQATFGYVAGPVGFLVWSPGPDTIDNMYMNGTTAHKGSEHIIRGGQSLPSPYLIAGPGGSMQRPAGAPTSGESYTYDATNGTASAGDVYRTK
jgi:prepilin-type N-terminal cleavage/methylation domain-containing protein